MQKRRPLSSKETKGEGQSELGGSELGICEEKQVIFLSVFLYVLGILPNDICLF